jgi:hypothetical protein
MPNGYFILIALAKALFRTEQSIPNITQTGGDIAMFIQAIIKGSGKDRHIGMSGPQGFNTLP